MWSSKERKEAVLICQQWLEWNIMNSDLNKILYYIKELYVVTDALLPSNDKIANAIERISILSDDTLEMNSISEEEKEHEIRKMVMRNKEELQNLARQVIAKLEEDFEQTKIAVKEQVKEMEARGFEEDTIKRFVENILGKEDSED